MITDPLLFDLATDHRLPYFKIKCQQRESFYYGQISGLYLHESPLRVVFDGYTQENWLQYCAGRWPEFDPIPLKAADIVSIELIGFSPVNTQKTSTIDTRQGPVAAITISSQDTLSRWNLRAMGILKQKPIVIDV